MWVKGEIFGNLVDARGSAAGSLDRATQPRLFDRIEWFERTMAHCPPARHVLGARARLEGCDGWLMLAHDGAGRAVSLGSWYTLRFAPVFTGTPDVRVKRALLTAIARRITKRFFMIRLAPMTKEDCAIVAAAFRRCRWNATITAKTGNWRIDVSGRSFADYWADRPGELRSTVKRKRARSGMTVTIHRDFDDEAWADYERIYAESWKGEEGSPAFVRDMARDAAAHGSLRLGVAQIDGEAVAAQLWTVENGVAIIHKLAYLPAASEHSPGSILSAAMFEAAIDTDHVDLIDYGTGNDRYKQDWMDSRIELFTLTMHNLRSPRGIAGAVGTKMAALVATMRSR